MKITFLGATKTVTGSNFLVEAAGKKFLVDCGLYQGKATEEWENSAPFPFNPKEIDFMILTHAHIDHSGRIPKLYNDGFRGKIYATKATCDLCSIMLPDSGHIQETEVEWKNKKRKRQGLPEIPPLYTAEDAIKCMKIFEPVEYDNIYDITDNLHIRFNDAGHMLGSSIVEVWEYINDERTKAVFTGDLGNNDIPLLAEPTMIDNADYVVMESTYGGRHHMQDKDKAEKFLDICVETLDKGGTVVIPSFAVGRTQEILFELNNIKEKKSSDPEFSKKYEKLMSVPVYVDSPLAISATQIFKDNMELFDHETQEIIKSGDNPLEFNGLKLIKSVEESRALNESNEPSIIISASGMCEVGRIKHHLKHHLWNPNSTVLFVGYQALGTLGRKIVDGAEKVKIFGEEIAVNARVEYIEGYSGHADQEWLLNFIYSFRNPPKNVFLVHGEPEGQLILKDKILETTNIPVIIPEFGEMYDLDDGAKLIDTLDKNNKFNYLRLEVIDRLKTLVEEVEDMKNIVMSDLQGDLKDKDVLVLNDRIKLLEQQIVNIISGDNTERVVDKNE